MLKVVGRKIYLTRGDTAYINVNVRLNNGDPYIFSEGDEVWFAMKRKTTDKEYSRIDNGAYDSAYDNCKVLIFVFEKVIDKTCRKACENTL